MRRRNIKWAKDLLLTQGRITMQLGGCGHFVSLTVNDIDSDLMMRTAVQALFTSPLGTGVQTTTAGMWNCYECADMTPIEIARERTVRELWKDAGEP